MEMEGGQQQRRQQQLHQSVVYGIARLSDPRYRQERHKLIVQAQPWQPLINRQSLAHLVTFLDAQPRTHDGAVVTELVLRLRLVNEPSDGGVNVLREFFARSNTTLTKVTLESCDFLTSEDASQLLAAFETNRTVKDLSLNFITHLRGDTLGACLSGLLRNMSQLTRLECSSRHLSIDGVRALQPALQENRTLRELSLSCCSLKDDGIRLVADALVGNMTIQVLNIGWNDITSNGLDNVTRLLESTQLKEINMKSNHQAFIDESATQRFARCLSRHEFLKDLGLDRCSLGDRLTRIIVDGLVGNMVMQFLDIRGNHITPVGLAHITRLLESTQLKVIKLYENDIFADNDATRHFVTTLQHKVSSVQELLTEHEEGDFSRYIGAATYARETYASIKNSLKRNQQLNRVNLLLVPPLLSQQQQQNHNHGAALIMFKTWHKAITKFAMVPNNAGASAIFKLFQARPALLEKRLARPTAATGTRQHGGGADTTIIAGQKRRRL